MIVKKILLKLLGEKKYLLFIATSYQRLYRTGKLGSEYQDVYFLKNIIHKDDYVMDIGAHLGYYTFELSRLVGKNGKVIGIEPVSKFYAVLEKIIRKKKAANIIVHKVALGGKGDTVEIGIPIVGNQKKFGYARIKEMHEYLEYAETEIVPNEIGDELMKDVERLDFIKCDVEGAELMVFASLLKTIQKFQPIILGELANKNDRIKMMEMLAPSGYEAYLLRNGKLHKLDVHSEERAISHNHYFIPASRLEKVKHLIVN